MVFTFTSGQQQVVRCEPWDEWNVFRMKHSKMYGSAEMVFHAHIYMYSLCVDLMFIFLT